MEKDFKLFRFIKICIIDYYKNDYSYIVIDKSFSKKEWGG